MESIRQKTAEIVISAVEKVFGIDVYLLNGEVKLDSADKINYYKAVSRKLKDLSQIKRDRLVFLNDQFNHGQLEGGLERLDLLEKIIENELSVIEIESNISNKDEYCNMFVEMYKISEQQNIADSKECDLLLQKYIKLANEILTWDKIKSTDKSQLHGALAQIHSGFRTIEQKAKLYRLFRDLVTRLK